MNLNLVLCTIIKATYLLSRNLMLTLNLKFGKFSLNISKYASSHGIRAELGLFPMKIFTDVKLVKYWHRLHTNINDDSILNECFVLCKNNSHSWYTNIVNMLNRSGLGYITKNPSVYSEAYVGNEIKKKLENEYLQSWTEKSSNCNKLVYLSKFKRNLYKRSSYLNNILDIEDRRRIIKLRLSCSNLNDHKFQKLNSSNKCPFCPLEVENSQHFLIYCPTYKDIRKKFYSSVGLLHKDFLDCKAELKTCSILQLKLLINNNVINTKFSSLCLTYIKDIFEFRSKAIASTLV